MNSFIKNEKPFKNSYSTSNTMPTINKPQSSDKLSMVNRLPISPLLMTYPKYKKSICSSISKGIIKVYGVNSYNLHIYIDKEKDGIATVLIFTRLP